MNKDIDIETPRGNVNAYLSKPQSACRGGIIVIHEVWGLTDHIKNIADRFAAEGYVAIAPDLLSGTINVEALSGMQEDLFDPEKRNEAQPKLREHMTPIHSPEFAEDTLLRLNSIFNYIYELPETQQRIAIAGYCFGGTYAYGLAVKEPRLLLALPFYGHADYEVEELSMICCPVRSFYGSKDENLMKNLPVLKEKMKKAKVDFAAKVYPDAGHAFFNDTNRFAYNKNAATDAWILTLNFLKKYVR